MGAAIAAGNHLENGIWALLVKAANIINRGVIILLGFVVMFIMYQCP